MTTIEKSKSLFPQLCGRTLGVRPVRLKFSGFWELIFAQTETGKKHSKCKRKSILFMDLTKLTLLEKHLHLWSYYKRFLKNSTFLRAATSFRLKLYICCKNCHCCFFLIIGITLTQNIHIVSLSGLPYMSYSIIIWQE